MRTEYRILQWHSKHGDKITSNLNPYAVVTDIDIGCEVKLNRSGTYHFYFLNQDKYALRCVYLISFLMNSWNFYSKDKTPCGSLYVQVEPVLHVGPPKAPKTIPLNSIRCQTVMSKCLGPLQTWESKLRVTKESGYNVIHFTPIQELGGSRSGYSLKDQLKVNPDFGRVTFDDVEKIVKKCRQEWGVSRNILIGL